MVDHDDEIDVGDNDEIDDADAGRVSVDPVAAAIALTDLADSFHRLYKLALTNKTKKARLRALAEIDRQAADAVAMRDEARREAAAIVEAAQAEVKAMQEAAAQRLDAAEAAEQELAEREQKIARLETAWRNIGEPEMVLRGFQSPEFSPLQKARLAVGRPPGKDPHQLLFAEPDAAPAMRIDALSDTSDDPHADRQGALFLGELTRDVSHHKRRGAA
jgi:hypothetical protein